MTRDPATEDPTSEEYRLRHSFLARKMLAEPPADRDNGLDKAFAALRPGEDPTDVFYDVESKRERARTTGRYTDRLDEAPCPTPRQLRPG